MTTHVQLFDKPLGLVDEPPTMFISGFLQGYFPGEQYEGRLQINNSIGDCVVYVLAGSKLPDGASVWVDQVTKEIVVQWLPASPTLVNTVPNGDIEAPGGWNMGGGWSWNNDGHHISGSYALKNVDFKGHSTVVSTALVPVLGSIHVNAQCLVWQRGDQGGWAGDGMLLSWYDESRNLISTTSSTSNEPSEYQTWHISKVSTVSPPNAAYVAAGAELTRHSNNTPIYVDDFTWDVYYLQGQDTDEEYPINLMVVDSLNRKATWSGTIAESFEYETSALYPLTTIVEKIHSGMPALTDGFLGLGLITPPAEGAKSTMRLVGGALVSTTTFGTINTTTLINTTLKLQGGSFVQAVSYGTAQSHADVKTTLKLQAGALTYAASYFTQPASESVKTTLRLVGGTLSH